MRTNDGPAIAFYEVNSPQIFVVVKVHPDVGHGRIVGRLPVWDRCSSCGRKLKRKGLRLHIPMYFILAFENSHGYADFSISGPVLRTLPTMRFAGAIVMASDSNGHTRSRGGRASSSVFSQRL